MDRELSYALPAFLAERVRPLAPGRNRPGRYVLYWMHHALRTRENPALDVARLIGERERLPVLVCQGLAGKHRFNSDRHHFFILQSARETAAELAQLGVDYRFHLDPSRHASVMTLAGDAAAIVVEEMPVPPFPGWYAGLARVSTAPVYAVDTRCIVPMQTIGRRHDRAFEFRAATEQAFAARVTAPYPDVAPAAAARAELAAAYPVAEKTDAALLEDIACCPIDHGVGPVWDTPGGSAAAAARWTRFRAYGLADYHRLRNDAAIEFPRGVSRLSAYVHYGCISPFRVAREAAADGGDGAKKFLDELLVWRELAHNFCFHTVQPESLSALPPWAADTLRTHAADPRHTVHSWDTLARGATGDELWDLAQRSLVIHGELHNNVRMTWAKQLLQWTPSPQEALAMLIDLNHRYALDGNDPNSYGGLLWALGLFDRPFEPAQPVLGAVRPRASAAHARRLDLARWGARVSRPSGRTLRIGIVGAGMAGLAAARTLHDHGHAVCVVDKARGPGGRMSTRRSPTGNFDHGAQYFTARDPLFHRRVEAWTRDGALARWPRRIAEIRGDARRLRSDDNERFVAVPSMNSLAKMLVRDLDLRLQSPVVRIVSRDRAWSLVTTAGARLGEFDAVIVTAPLPQAAALLEASGLALPKALRAVTMSPCWAVMLTTPPVVTDFDAAALDDESIAWIAHDAARPGRATGTSASRWVVHATPEYSRRRLESPPENVAVELAERACMLLAELPPPLVATAHRWRYARTEGPAPDAAGGAVSAGVDGLWIAGDGCRGASRVEDAWLSGIAAAGRILGRAGPQDS